ncbi:hypothetical protein VTJ04DRAFT_1296 [Mycothermus thermophilus]|uniref:uncharacterized protein n=1 Tax=Humicola insolens TaxID=85995 RepID=UPI00374427B2
MRSSDFGRMRLEDVRWGNHQKLSLVMVMEEEVGKSSGGVNSAEKMFKPEWARYWPPFRGRGFDIRQQAVRFGPGEGDRRRSWKLRRMPEAGTECPWSKAVRFRQVETNNGLDYMLRVRRQHTSINARYSSDES